MPTGCFVRLAPEPQWVSSAPITAASAVLGWPLLDPQPPAARAPRHPNTTRAVREQIRPNALGKGEVVELILGMMSTRVADELDNLFAASFLSSRPAEHPSGPLARGSRAGFAAQQPAQGRLQLASPFSQTRVGRE